MDSISEVSNKSNFKTFFRGIFENYLKEASAFLALIVIIVFFTIVKPNFIAPKNLLLLLEMSALVGIVAIGQFIVMLVGGIDLSIGSVVGLSGIVSAFLMSSGKFSTSIALIGGLAVGILFGIFNGIVITKLKIVDFIVTLGSLFIAHGIIVAMTRGYSIYTGIQPSFLKIGNTKLAGMSTALIAFIVLAILAQIILSTTVFGRRLYATGGNRTAAKLMGVSVDWLKIIAYIISGFLASCVGILIVGRLKSGQPAAGDSFLFETILAVVLGGASLSGGEGTVVGTFIGSIILASIFNGLTMSGFSYFYQEIVKGVIFLIAISLSSFASMRRSRI